MGYGTPARNRDWRRFLADTDRAYAEELYAYLRDELKVKAPICDTQISYGRLAGFYREQNMDYTDAHGYWQHPEFPGRPFDFHNWFIGNTAQIDVMHEPENKSLLRDLALMRVAGKPYIISEFDHPSPNDYAAEMLATTAAFASLQDWDGIVLFCLSENPEVPKIDLWFDSTHPGKFGFLPQAALMFRTGAFPASEKRSQLSFPQDMWLDENLHAANAWQMAAGGAPMPDVLRQQVAVSDKFLPPDAAPKTATGTQASPRAGQTDSEITVKPNPDAPGNIFRAHSGASAVLVGRVKEATAGALTISKVVTDGGFVSASAVAMDVKPFKDSRRILFTIANRFENVGMKWNAERTSVGNDWGTGPIIAAGVNAEVALAVPAGGWKVYALDAHGHRREEVSAKYAGEKLVFEVKGEHEAIWYEIVR